MSSRKMKPRTGNVFGVSDKETSTLQFVGTCVNMPTYCKEA
jgi:hypothetical protein